MPATVCPRRSRPLFAANLTANSLAHLVGVLIVGWILVVQWAMQCGAQEQTAGGKADQAAEERRGTREMIAEGRRVETTDPVLAAGLFAAAAGRSDVPQSILHSLRTRAATLYADTGQLDDASDQLMKLGERIADQDAANLTLQIASRWLARGDAAAATVLYQRLLDQSQVGGSDVGQPSQIDHARLGLLWCELADDAVGLETTIRRCDAIIVWCDSHHSHTAAAPARAAVLATLQRRIGVAIERSNSSDSLVEALLYWRSVGPGQGIRLAGWLQAIEGETAATVATEMLDRSRIEPFDRDVSSMVRWAGRHRRWTLLSAMADQWSPDELIGTAVGSDAPSRPSELAEASESAEVRFDVTRLIAESLVQTGRPRESLRWWRVVCQTPTGRSFAARMRLAELETALGKDLSAAQTSIDAARTAVDRADPDHPSQYRMVDLVEAKWLIRRAEFDDARYLLEQIVRRSHHAGLMDGPLAGSSIGGSSVGGSSMAGQAQWLIGETWMMQNRHAEAIEAYRRVDGIDPGGRSSPAAMAAAGRCFERLGRTREAAVCYHQLLSLFGDSPHASEAADRLALLGEGSSSIVR